MFKSVDNVSYTFDFTLKLNILNKNKVNLVLDYKL